MFVDTLELAQACAKFKRSVCIDGETEEQFTGLLFDYMPSVSCHNVAIVG